MVLCRRRGWPFWVGVDGIGWGHLSFTGCLAGALVSIFGGFIANKTQDSPHNVGNDELLGLGLDKAAADAGDVVDKAVYVVPSGAGNNLEEDVGSCYSAGFGALDLASLEEAIDARLTTRPH